MSAPFSEVRSQKSEVRFRIFTFFSVIFIFTFCILILSSSVHAQTEGASCQYREEHDDGMHVCAGIYQSLNGDTSNLTCQFQEGVTISPCPLENTSSGSSSTTPAGSETCTNPNGCEIKSTNFFAPEFSDYGFENLLGTLMKQSVGCAPTGAGDGGVNYVLEKDNQGNNQVTLKKTSCQPGGGASGQLTNFMVAMYTNPPTSTKQYLASLGENFGVKPAYAQVGGSGEGIIHPVLALWQATRNIAYVAFILVFVVVGLMIMFRARINQQTVVSAQQALPGLVIGLILVTFSYFLASLLVDVAFLSIQIVGQIFAQVGNNIFNPTAQAHDSNVFNLFRSSIVSPGDFIGGIYQTLNSIGGVGAVTLIPAAIGAVIGTIINPGLGTAIGFGIGAGAGPVIIGLIVPLILILALLIQFFRLLWQLISSYIAILVSTVTGPLIILFASIPGRGGALGLWWRSLLGNALVFPAVFAAFMFAGMILGTETGSFNSAPPLFGGLSTQLLRLIIAYGIILGTPAIPGMVKKAMGVPELGNIPQAALGGFVTGAQAGGAFAGPTGRGAAAAGERLLRGPAAAAPGGRLEQIRERLLKWSQPPRRP